MSLHIQRAAHKAMGPVLERWMASATQGRGRLPTPDDDPMVFAPGPDPDRILLMGGGVVRGNGVTSHDLGLGGHLARRLSATTGRGAEVDIQWRPMMSPDVAAALLDEFDLTQFDAIVMILGSREAVSLLPIEDWQQDLSVVMDAVGRNASAALPVFLIGIPQMPDFLTLPAAIRSAIMRRTDLLNNETEHFCLASHRIHYLPISVARGSLRTYGDTQTYLRWATQFAPAIAHALDAASGHPDAGKVDEGHRCEALRALRAALASHDERLDQITHAARDLLGASVASLVFLEDDPVVMSMQAGEESAQTRLPMRDESFVVATIKNPTAFVVQGDELMRRFGNHPWVHGPEKVRFYAGYPIETPDGYRVGALGIAGGQPREFGDAERAVLRDLALRVQELLWGAARA